ncbi:MAG: hypothetical protein JO154_19690 [Chitinophaga sp.]|uniref:ABC-three component system protein n=1 Tax=Chitinophaga sp. TaxID=1869181 RepID=UPI0025BBBE27|nr:ABC-three component system protein [Chitinophaga sp.]MBV8254833.1 hypothetical protein [Chitinophaga sp.]
MPAPAQYERLILSLTDDDLEKFVLDWVDQQKSKYVRSQKFSGPGDAGRDVVGFLTKEYHSGPWHNYQCKQYAKKLVTSLAVSEIGKILYYAQQGKFTAPEKYYFVVPRGVNRNLEDLLLKPQDFKSALVRDWDKYCLETIIEGTKVPLSEELKSFIEGYDFSNITSIAVHDILKGDSIQPVLDKWFNQDPGPAPTVVPPDEIQENETGYVNQLLAAYSERESQNFNEPQDIIQYPDHMGHLSLQRERFYAAESFKSHFRDNTSLEIISGIEDDVYYGVIDVCNEAHSDALARVDKVMQQAANISVTGVLAKHAKVVVRQGICHQHANLHKPKLKWKK